jgi:hypothetical protein
MTIDPKTLTLLCLAARDHALDESSTALTQDLTGNPANDNSIKLELANITAERYAIASRRAALAVAGATFTAPDPTAVNALQLAINALHTSIVANANANSLMTLTTQLLNQYSAAKSA